MITQARIDDLKRLYHFRLSQTDDINTDKDWNLCMSFAIIARVAIDELEKICKEVPNKRVPKSYV